MEKNLSEELLQQIRNCTNLIHRLTHSERRTFHTDAKENKIGRGQGLVLRILAEKDGLTQTEITEMLNVRPSSLGELVAKLESNGYVDRRQNGSDKRVINVFLTEKGREAEKKFINPRREAAQLWCSGLSEDEKVQLSGLLSKMIASMEEALSKNEDAGQETPFGLGCPKMDQSDFTHHGSHFFHSCQGKECEGDRKKRRRKMAEQYWQEHSTVN
jgi:DNA-binding MarR family transcriptional regulator